jgi:P4 family phage/plasmid primase-like protien
MSYITDKHPWHKSITKRNPKIQVILDRVPSKTRYDTKWPGVELLCGQWSYALSIEEVYNADMPILQMSLSDILGEKNKRLNQMCQSLPSADLTGDPRVPKLITGDKVTDYYDWLAVVSAMRNSGYTIQDAHEVSSRASNYDPESVNAKWAEAPKLSQYTFKTLCHYAKESDSDAFTQLYMTRRVEQIKQSTSKQESEVKQESEETQESEESEIATELYKYGLTNAVACDIFKQIYGNDYAYSHNQWFRINKHGIYEKLDADTDTILTKNCMVAIRQFVHEQLKQNINNSDRIKTLGIALRDSQSNQFMKHTTEMLRVTFLDESLYSKLDKNLKLVGFKNGVYDLNQRCFRNATREDYVSITTKYDYSDECNHEYFDKLIESIFENKARAAWFKVFLGSLIIGGNPEEKCYFLVGGGRNGKGTIDSLIRFALGAYYGDVPSSYYTTPDVAGRASPEVMSFKNVRVAMTQEPASGEQAKYHTDKVKRGSGNDPLTGRYLYGNLETFQPNHKPLCCTNYLPTFTDIDDGIKARLVVVLFPLQFMDAANYDPSIPSHRKQNSGLKIELEQYRHMFFNYMLEQYKKYAADGLPPLPACMLEDLREYQDEVDTVKTFMKSSLKQVESECVPLADLHKAFKQHEDMALNVFSSRIKKQGYKIARRTTEWGKVACVIGYDWC